MSTLWPLILPALLGLDAPVQGVVDALVEKGCPRLFAMLSPEFQKAVPAAQWPAFCDGLGIVGAVERAGEKKGWPIYRAHGRAHGAARDWELGLALAGGRITGLYAKPWREPETAKTLDEKLAQVALHYQLPGIAALRMEGGRVTAQSTSGVRKLGDKTPVANDDRWHLGSDTKAMTATLAALLIADGKLSFQSTIGEVFPDWKDLNPGYAPVTVEALLEHRGGLAHESPKAVMARMWEDKDVNRARVEAVHALLREPPGKVGAFEYSNGGYLVVGAMLQRVAGEPWETLMQKRIFAPLGMTSCGFGALAKVGTVDAPWAHHVSGGRLEPIAPGPESDNPPALGPAGTVHCSLPDWAKFVEEHLRGERGESTQLKLSRAIYQKLHTAPAGGNYALGWGIAKGLSGPVLTHDGSNTLFYAVVVASTAKDALVLVATNRGDDNAAAATHEVIEYLGEQAGGQY